MPRSENYGDLTARMERILEKQSKMKDGIAQLCVEGVNKKDKVVMVLSRLPKRLQRRAVDMMLDNVEEYAAAAMAEELVKKKLASTDPAQSAKPAGQPSQTPLLPMPNRVMDRGEFRPNPAFGALGIWDLDSGDWYISMVRPGMAVEVPEVAGWSRVIIEQQQEDSIEMDKGQLYYQVEEDGKLYKEPIRENFPVRSIRGAERR